MNQIEELIIERISDREHAEIYNRMEICKYKPDFRLCILKTEWEYGIINETHTGV